MIAKVLNFRVMHADELLAGLLAIKFSYLEYKYY